MESYVPVYVDHFKASRRTCLFSLRPSPNGLSTAVDGFSEGSGSNLRMYMAFYRYCRGHRRDQVHLLNSGPIILLISLLAGMRSPIYHIHGTKYWKRRQDKVMQRFIWHLSRPFKVLFIANSKYCAMLFRKHTIPVEPKVVYNGFDAKSLQDGRRRRTSLDRMAYVGRIAPGKNAKIVVELFNAIAVERTNLELHVAGSGSLEKAMRDEALMSPFRRRIFFHGWISDLTEFYRSMDLMVFPSSHESFGNVLAEGLMNGLPVLTSDVPVFEEIHGDKETFCIGSPDDPLTFRNKFVAATSRFEVLSEKAFLASDRVAGMFNMKDHLNAIEQAYEQR